MGISSLKSGKSRILKWSRMTPFGDLDILAFAKNFIEASLRDSQMMYFYTIYTLLI